MIRANTFLAPLVFLLAAALPAAAQEGDVPSPPAEQPAAEQPAEEPPEQPAPAEEAPEQPAPAEEAPADAPAARGLTLELSTAPEQVSVGGTIKATVALKNTGEEPLTLPKLAEDRQIVSFDVKLDDGKTFTYEKIVVSPYEPKTDWPTGELAPGDAWELSIELPAIAAGEFTIQAHYGRASAEGAEGLSPKPPHVTSQARTVTITPGEGGAEEVAVHMLTNLGPVRIRLYPREALATSLHFANLVREGFYEGLTFHRVIKDFMIQGGDPLGTGMGGPGYSIPAELAAKGEGGQVPEKLQHVPGKLSMARSGHVDSAGSQFFVVVGPSPALDAQYTVFGEVTRGMDAVYTISEVSTGAKDKPLQDVVIQEMFLTPGERQG